MSVQLRVETIADVIDQALFDADYLLTRYGRWSMDRYKKQHCASAERNYRPPKNDDDRKPMLEMPPEFEAMNVHRAVIRVPCPYRLVLFAHYVKTRVSVEAQKRKMGMSWRQFDLARVHGLRMFWNIYTKSNGDIR